MLQQTNSELDFADFADVLIWVQLICDAPSDMVDEEGRGATR